MKILFVCRGNVGRSQMAEAMFNKLVKDERLSSSAGTQVYTVTGESAEGQSLHQLDSAKEVIQSMNALGFDISNNQRNLVTPRMVQEAEKVIVMAESDTIPDFLKENPKVVYWNIEDPKGKNQLETNKIRDDILNRVKDLVQEVGGLGISG